MKAAVLVFGMLREYDRVIPTWNLNEHLDCDYFLSTWSKSKQKIDYLGPETPDNCKEFEITEDLIKPFLPNCTCSIVEEDKIFPSEAVTKVKLSYYFKMFFHWKNLYNLMLNSGKEYDLVILIRPDVMISLNTIANWQMNEDILYCDDLMKIRKTDPVQFPNEPFHYLCNDLFFCGSMKIFDKLMKVIPDMTQDEFKHKSWIPHIDLAKLLLSIDMFPNDLHPFRISYPIRPHPWQTTSVAE
jgi:hypothetical protein